MNRGIMGPFADRRNRDELYMTDREKGAFMQRYTICEIDLAAIRHNVGVMKAHVAGGAKFLAVVKANAYGHGAVPVAKAALEAGADMLAVAIPEEGIELRRAGITAPILVLGGIEEAAAHDVVQKRVDAGGL